MQHLKSKTDKKDFLNAVFSSVSFSHDGRRLAWVGHDSSIAVADAGMAVSCWVMNDSVFVEFYVVEVLNSNIQNSR